MALVGGLTDIPVDSPEVAELTKLVLSKLCQGVDEEITLVEVIKARRQVVSGRMTHMILKVSVGGVHKKFEASIWEQPWMNKTEITKLHPLDEDTEIDNS